MTSGGIALLARDSARGHQIEIKAVGCGEKEALAVVITLFNAGFGAH